MEANSHTISHTAALYEVEVGAYPDSVDALAGQVKLIASLNRLCWTTL